MLLKNKCGKKNIYCCNKYTVKVFIGFRGFIELGVLEFESYKIMGLVLVRPTQKTPENSKNLIVSN